MTPILFSCEATLTLPPEEIAAQILDVANWTTFTGYAFLPGIRTAQFEVRTPEIVGSRIRVTSTDGSSHVEEIVEWSPGRLRLEMKEFSPPLCRLATKFDEAWEFEPGGPSTRVVRNFALHPTSAFSRPALWLISRFLKRAVMRQLRQMRSAPSSLGSGVRPPPNS